MRSDLCAGDDGESIDGKVVMAMSEMVGGESGRTR